MNFGYLPSYYNPMDRAYDRGSGQGKETPLREVELGNIGISSNPMQNQLDGLKARIFQGASTVELGFSGRGKGSMGGQNTTPEMYGADEREDIRQMADFNKVKLSTHASYNIGTLSGMTQQGFDNSARENTLREIQRAIDFAGDTARGGAVVVHTGEFPRALSEMTEDHRDKETGNYDKFGKFEIHPNETKEAVIQFVDKNTGHIQSISKNMSFMMPEWQRSKDGKGFEKDEELNGWPKPVYNEKTGKFKMDNLDWEKLTELTNWYNKENGTKLTPGQALLELNTELQLKNSAAIVKNYERYYKQAIETEHRVEEAFRALDAGNTDAAVEALAKSSKDPNEQQMIRDQLNKLQGEQKERQIKAMLERAKEEAEGNMEYFGPTIMAHHQQEENTREQMKRLMPIEDYAKEKTADTIARAAEFAHQKSEALKEKGLLKSPIYISPENIFPETYGAHPQELKQIIIESRNKFIENNKKRYGEDEARKLAENHIKATFDIGHAYTWRKYYKDDPNKSWDQNDADFKKWLMGQVEDLNKKGYIGHVHVSDNFGYEDEHVTPGQGRAPIKDFIDRMKKAGTEDVIVEPAHQDYRAVLGAWREFGSPIYGADASLQKWTDVQFSYFGKNRSPYFVFGEYAPSQDFTLWSQVPLE